MVFVRRGLFRAHVAVLTLDEEAAPGENRVDVIKRLVPLRVGSQDHVANVSESGRVARILRFV